MRKFLCWLFHHQWEYQYRTRERIIPRYPVDYTMMTRKCECCGLSQIQEYERGNIKWVNMKEEIC